MLFRRSLVGSAAADSHAVDFRSLCCYAAAMLRYAMIADAAFQRHYCRRAPMISRCLRRYAARLLLIFAPPCYAVERRCRCYAAGRCYCRAHDICVACHIAAAATPPIITRAAAMPMPRFAVCCFMLYIDFSSRNIARRDAADRALFAAARATSARHECAPYACQRDMRDAMRCRARMITVASLAVIHV